MPRGNSIPPQFPGTMLALLCIKLGRDNKIWLRVRASSNQAAKGRNSSET
jgi:hypothetical protein